MVLSPGIISQKCLSASNMSKYLVFALRGAAISLYVLRLELIYNVYFSPRVQIHDAQTISSFS